ncbi:MAG: hypothetical protein ACRDTE_10245 [Pseudonocardiaceae bacterium]
MTEPSTVLRKVASAIARNHGPIPDGLRDAVAVALAHCPDTVIDRLSRTEGTSRLGSWLGSREALGTRVTTPSREGLPEFTTALGQLSPIEVVAYWHPDPVFRLTANRFARKLDLNVTWSSGATRTHTGRSRGPLRGARLPTVETGPA